MLNLVCSFVKFLRLNQGKKLVNVHNVDKIYYNKAIEEATVSSTSLVKVSIFIFGRLNITQSRIVKSGYLVHGNYHQVSLARFRWDVNGQFRSQVVFLFL